MPSLPRLEGARSLDGFHRHLYGCAGYPDQQTYIDHCNPMAVMDRVSIPLLVLNAVDDPVCVVENVRDHQQQLAEMTTTILALTERGSHCAYLGGLLATNWAH